MAVTFKNLKRASWTVNGTAIEFPVKRCSVKGSLRHHVHEYPHVWGGATEKLGRKLYTIKMSVPMLGNLRNYPLLWPEKWSVLRSSFEAETVGTLHIPTVGSIKAVCTEWPEDMDAKIQSGVMVELDFLEDQSQRFLVEQMIDAGRADIASTAMKLMQTLDQKQISVDIFQSIQNVANDILAIRDQAELFSTRLEAKILGLDALVREADKTVLELQHPENWVVLDALRALWESTQKLNADLQQKRTPLETRIAPKLMTITDVSIWIYGDAKHGADILDLNAFDDAFAIPAGTRIRYYSEAA